MAVSWPAHTAFFEGGHEVLQREFVVYDTLYAECQRQVSNYTFLLRLALNRYLSCWFYFDPAALARRNNNADPTNSM